MEIGGTLPNPNPRFGIGLDCGVLMIMTGMLMRGEVTGLVPLNTWVGWVGFLIHGSMAGDLGL